MVKKISGIILRNYPALTICFFYFLLASLVSLHRFWQYESFYYDFGIFDRALWLVSKFQIPTIDHIALGRTIIFADHFSPSLFLISPIYWITNRSEILFIIQAIAVSLSGLILYQIAKNVLRNRIISVAIMISYLLFVGLQNAIITDFHEVTIATLPLMLVFWAFTANKTKWYWLFLLLSLGFKESMFTVGIGIGLFILILLAKKNNSEKLQSDRTWFKSGIITIIFSILYGILATKIIIPFFSQGIYMYAPQFPDDKMLFFTGFFNDPVKRRTLWYSMLSFGFIPLFSIATWPLLISDFLVRFIPLNTAGRWTLGMHYNALTAVILGVAMVYGLKPISNLIHALRKSQNRIINVSLGFILIFISLFLHQKILHGPLGLGINADFYRHTRDFKFLNDFVALIPNNASVMTQNHLAVRFTHQDVYLADIEYRKYHPDYIILDLRPEQNPNDFFGYHGKIFSQFSDSVASDSAYQKIFDTNHQVIYRHK